MSLFESSITGNILNDGSTTSTTGITAGQLATVLTAYTPLSDTATNAASISANSTSAANNAAALAVLQTQVDNLPPIGLGHLAAGGGQQVHPDQRGHEAPGLLHNGSHE